jgi:hypothetical protein
MASQIPSGLAHLPRLKQERDRRVPRSHRYFVGCGTWLYCIFTVKPLLSAIETCSGNHHGLVLPSSDEAGSYRSPGRTTAHADVKKTPCDQFRRRTPISVRKYLNHCAAANSSFPTAVLQSQAKLLRLSGAVSADAPREHCQHLWGDLSPVSPGWRDVRPPFLLSGLIVSDGASSK